MLFASNKQIRCLFEGKKKHKNNCNLTTILFCSLLLQQFRYQIQKFPVICFGNDIISTGTECSLLIYIDLITGNNQYANLFFPLVDSSDKLDSICCLDYYILFIAVQVSSFSKDQQLLT